MFPLMLEPDMVPFSSAPPPGERILVLAPHPDDETLGCGGTLKRLVETGKKVKVVFLTSGDKSDPSHPASAISRGQAHLTDYALLREKEALEALGVLGIADHQFLRFPDRGLYERLDELREQLVGTMRSFLPDVIYSPSPVELNPDHRAAATAAILLGETAARDLSYGEKAVSGFPVAFYEVTTPLRPNLLVDVSGLFPEKKKAILRYESQLAITDYLGYIISLNRFRSLTVQGAEYIEAFWVVRSNIPGENRKAWLSYCTPQGTQ